MVIKNKPKKYTLVKGDIFHHSENRINAGQNGSHVIIPHVCNNINVFGGGFAADVAQRYPECKENFHLLGRNAKLGHVQFVKTREDNKYKFSLNVANMIAQNKLIGPNNPRPLHYGALVYCMNQVRAYAVNLMKQPDSNRVEIHAPKFGSGLAGGNWLFIEELINDIWGDINTFIYLK